MAKKKNASGTPKPDTEATETVRVWARIAKMANIISTTTGESVAAILSPMVEEQLTRRFKEVVKQLNEGL